MNATHSLILTPSELRSSHMYHGVSEAQQCRGGDSHGLQGSFLSRRALNGGELASGVVGR